MCSVEIIFLMLFEIEGKCEFGRVDLVFSTGVNRSRRFRTKRNPISLSELFMTLRVAFELCPGPGSIPTL